MSDASFSASQLRQRYGKGGSLPDSELSASQLRSRAGIQGNARDFSTKDNASSMPPVAIILAALVVIGVIAYFVAH